MLSFGQNKNRHFEEGNELCSTKRKGIAAVARRIIILVRVKWREVLNVCDTHRVKRQKKKDGKRLIPCKVACHSKMFVCVCTVCESIKAGSHALLLILLEAEHVE